MKNNDIVLEAGRFILRPIAVIDLICFLGFIISPFLWIWFGWDIAWKTGLTGLIGSFLASGVYFFIKHIIAEIVEEVLKQEDQKPVSKFQQRLDELIEKREKKV